MTPTQRFPRVLSQSLICGLLGVTFFLVPVHGMAQVGIASKYVGDQGIANDPDVIFAENFESTLANFSARFTGGGPSGIATSTDHPSASSGVQSVRLIPSGGNGTLYRQLPGNYNMLYFRYYIKYLGNVSHHAGGYMGGYYPPSGWPQGDSGLKGIRSDGSRLFISAFEQQGSPDGIQPATRLDTYNNFVGMQGSAFNGQYYGRNYLITEKVPLNVGQWQCVEMRVKMNTTATARDGELQIWINGTQVQNFIPGSPVGAYDASGMWRTGAGSGFPGLQWRDVLTYGINWIKLQNYSDLGTPYDVLFDDLVVATKPIGPIRPAGDTTVPPPAPTNLRVM